MKTKRHPKADSAMHATYDFSNGVRGKHSRALQNGYTIKIRQADGTFLIKKLELTTRKTTPKKQRA